MTPQNKILQRIAHLNKKDDILRVKMLKSDTNTMMRYIALCSEIQQEIGFLYSLLSGMIDERREIKETFRLCLEIVEEGTELIDQVVLKVDKGHIESGLYEKLYSFSNDYKIAKV